jgi:PAS domain-containing protein
MDDARVAQKQVEQRNAEMEVVLTELKQAQESLRKAYDEMDARVQERTRELAVANRELSNEIAERKLTEQKIELERDKLKSILDTMQDGVYIVNQDYEVEYINPVIEKEFGKVNGRKCYQFFYNHPDICKSCVHEQVLHGNVLSTERTSEITGRVYDLLDMPLRNSDGSVSKLRIIHDITHLKEKEQQLRHYNLELQNISMAEHKQRQFSEALVEAALALNKSTDLEEVLTRILERINAVIPYQLAGIALLEGESFYFANHQGDRSWPDAQIGTQSRFSLDDIP